MPVLLARALVVSFTAAAALAQARAVPHPLEPSQAWLDAVQRGTRLADGRLGPAHWTNHADYELTAELDPALARVQGHAKITYTNRSPEPIPALTLHLRQNLHAPDAMRNVVVEVTGGMKLARTSLGGAPVELDVRGTLAEVWLPQPLAPGASLVLETDFAFDVPQGEAPRMGREGRSVYFLGYWYPQLAVHDDVRGVVAEPYLGTSEFCMDWADYDVAFTVPAGWLVQATGELQNAADVLSQRTRDALARAATSTQVVRVVAEEDRTRGDVTAAAPGGSPTWRFRATRVRDFAISTSPEYLWDAAAADVGDRDGDGTADRCVVHALYRPAARSWRTACRHAQHTITALSRDLLPYPYPHATVAEGILGGGMEYPMLVLCGDQRTPFANQSLIAHELVHLWFPMIVGNDETAFGWQDEGLADWFTARLEREFWKLRRPSAAQAGYRTFARAGLDREAMLRHADHLVYPESYVFLCYTKPAAVLDQLAGMVGEEKVLAAVRDYARAFAFAHPTPEDFFAAMNRSLGEDLGWYWSTWWTETWTLDHAIGDVRPGADGTTTEVMIEDRGRAPHPARVRATLADGSTAEQTVPVTTWLGGARRAVLTFAGVLDDVLIDPDHTTLDLDRKNDTWTRSK